MADERKKVYSKKGTGTIPKMKYTRKYRNNTACLNQSDAHRNNLGLDCQGDFSRNFIPSNYYLMDTSVVENQESLSCLNKIPPLNVNGNGASSSNTSGSMSRRDSLGTVPKCDNVTKYPDQKQIEEKLNKIQEYLRVTNSLMSSMKNTDDQCDDQERENLIQMANDLKDSESKLILLLAEVTNENMSENEMAEVEIDKMIENGTENVSEPSTSDSQSFKKNSSNQKDDHMNQEILYFRNQQNALLALQQKAENKLRQARLAQEKLLLPHNSQNQSKPKSKQSSFYEVEDNGYQSSNSSMKFVENHFDVSMKELEDQIKNFKLIRQAENSVQQKISVMHDSNDTREHLIQLLDNRDAQLQTEHLELQDKLIDLQNKKMQVDHLVHQLEHLQEEADSEDVGVQVKKIVTMKEQLAKLKDLLEIVKTSESLLETQNVNDSDFEEAAQCIGSKTNLIQNDVKSSRTPSNKSLSNLGNNTRWSCEKQINKSSLERDNITGANPKSSSDQEKLRLQVELQAKKRELEEIMCKHKAGTSNLNHDVGSENKSDFGSASNSFFESVSTSWFPIPTTLPHNRTISSDRYSSDDCPEEDINEYTELNSATANIAHSLQPSASSLYSNYEKEREELIAQPETSQLPNQDFERFRLLERSLHCNQNQPVQQGERCRSNNEQETQNKTQTQKQLELIRSVCDSMLENRQQQTSNTQQSNLQHLRNNLTPSPLYSEPRQYASPNPRAMNAVNVFNNPNENPWGMSALGSLCYSPADINGYQNFLATNTLQTQAFMLNTLNHCCQMLWLQQRELAALRNTVSLMQERSEQNSSFANSNPFICPPIPNSTQYRPTNPKVNHVSSAYSLPNLNQNNSSQTNNDLAYVSQNNNQNARLLDTGLNNTVPPNHHNVGVNNSLLHNTNSSVNQTLPSQIWNGQALNNQVAPGNRANNYWDNFRSYSRQNLLSTKSNEMLQNSALERSNNASHILSFPPSATNPKLNVQQGSANSSEDSFSRSMQTKTRRSRNTSSAPPVPPDVLNINQSSSPKLNDTDLSEDMLNFQDEFTFQQSMSFTEISSNNSNMSDNEQRIKEGGTENQRNRNEWHKHLQNEPEPQKSKLFEELRENVYKEVASLISANEGRPHFLIQLFRDLQLISSDPLRRQTLQSIQSLITNSLASNAQGATQQVPNNNTIIIPQNQENLEFSLWPQTSKLSSIQPSRNSSNFEYENILPSDQRTALDCILVFLDLHNEEILQSNLMESLKAILKFSDLRIANFQLKNKTSLLTETLDQFKGKKICDIKMQLIQSIIELFKTQIVVQVEESMSENLEVNTSNEMRAVFCEEVNPPQIQNGDLAEADQSRPEIEEDEEEGAVGGILNHLNEHGSNKTTEQLGADDADFTKIDIAVNVEGETEFTEHGLDQVPTRLTIHPKSRSNTPNRDQPEHY